MTQWVAHFERNAVHHRRVDAARDVSAACALPAELKDPLIASVRRFQLGESGDGAQLLRKAAAAGDAEYLSAARLFVGEEQRHAALLMQLLDYLDAQPIERHWSDTVFVALRRALGLRTELMVLTIAEVIALSYYATLENRCPDAFVEAIASSILADERAHVEFHAQRIAAGFAASGRATRRLARLAWWLIMLATGAAVAIDHGPLLRALGGTRRAFVGSVLADFRTVARTALG